MSADIAPLRAENESFRAENLQHRAAVAVLRATLEKLTRALEEFRRSGKRQAAPLSARHRQCLAHRPGRCRELIDVAAGGAARLGRQVKERLQAALALRDWRGKRTIRGAVVQGILISVLRTLAQREADWLKWLAAALRATKPRPLTATGR